MKKNQISKQRQQGPLSLRTIHAASKERTILTITVVFLIICLLAFMDLCFAALYHKRSSLLHIKVNQTSATILASCFLALYFCALWAVKKQSKKFYRSLYQQINPIP